MSVDVETICELMHDAYERAAVGAGWETNPHSRKPWADVPEANKATMRAAVSALWPVLAEVFHEGRVAENEAFQRDPRGLYYHPANPYAVQARSSAVKGDES